MNAPVDPLCPRPFGRYAILDRLGSGGMGDVYRARDLKLGRQVAIKVLRDAVATDGARLARFEQEARAASALNHPAIVTIYEIDSVEGTPYIAMELVEGKTLRELLQSGPLPYRRTLRIAAQAADGLARAHAAGIVHRDLKPENLMILDDGRLKILDFGLAKLVPPPVSEEADTGALHASGTQPGVILGTVGYMSPEQAMGRAVDFRSDQFAYGLILYEMVTGQPPFKRPSAVQTMAAIIEAAPEPILKLNPDVSAPLCRIVDRCLAKDPRDRYASTHDLVRDIDNIFEPLAEVPVGPVGGVEGLAALRAVTGAWRVRRPKAALLVGLVVAAGVAATSFSRRPAPPSASPPTVAVVTPRRSVAVLGFKNLSRRADAAWLSTALAEMLTTELAAGGRLRTIPGENVGRMKMELALSEADSLAADTLARVGTNLGTDFVLLGSYFRQASGEVRLDLRLQEVAKGETAAVMAETGTEAQLVDLVTRVGARLRESIGVDAPTPAEAGALKAGVPGNLDAQRLYAEGLARLRVLDALAARDLLVKSVAADPDFPMAHAALAEAWSKLGYDARAREEAKRALDLSGHLSREERLVADARYRETAGEWDEAVEIHRALVTFFPDNLDYGLRLAAAQAAAGRGRDALVTLEAVRRLPALGAAGDPRIDLVEAEAAQALGDHRHQRTAAARAAAKGAALGAKLLAARALLLEAHALGRLGDATGAAAAAENAQRTFAEAGDRGGVGRAVSHIGSVLYLQGHLVEAARKHEDALALLREVGHVDRVADVVKNVGLVLWQQGDLAGARRKCDEALALDRERGHKRGSAFAVTCLANVLLDQADLAGARRHAGEVMRLSRETGDDATAARALESRGNVLAASGDLAAARNDYEEALRFLRASGNKRYAAFLLHDLGRLALAEGDLEEARKRFDEALSLRSEYGDKLTIAETQVALAKLALEEARPERADELSRQALPVFEAERARDKEALAHAVRALALSTRRMSAVAAAECEAAHRLAERSQNPHVRLEVSVAVARARRATATREVLATLDAALAEATRLGLVGLQLEIRLARGAIEQVPQRAAGSGRLDALEREARARGFHLVARKATQLAQRQPRR